MDKPPLPQPQLKPTGITSDQYFDYTPEKLELSNDFYNYGGQDFTGFYLAVLTNMLLREAVLHVPMSKWSAEIQEVALQNPKLDDALRARSLSSRDSRVTGSCRLHRGVAISLSKFD